MPTVNLQAQLLDDWVVSPEESLAAIAARMVRAPSGMGRVGQPAAGTGLVGWAAVVEQGQPVGVLTPQDWLQLAVQGRSLADLIVAQVMGSPVVVSDLGQGLSLSDIGPLQHRVPGQPLLLVDTAGHLQGMITPDSLLRGLPSLAIWRQQTVAEVMTPNPVQVPDSVMGIAIAHLMSTPAVQGVGVTCAQGGRSLLLGLLSEQDLVRAYLQGRDLATETAAQLTSCPWLTLRPTDTLAQAQQLMGQYPGKAIAIVDEQGHLAGLLTATHLWQGLTFSPLDEPIQVIPPPGPALTMATGERDCPFSPPLEQPILELILETVLAGYWDANLVTQEQYISPGFKRMFGYGDAELPNSPDTWKRLILPEDLPKAEASYQQHVQSHGQIPYHNELRYRHRDGSIVWVLCTGRVIEWDGAGNPQRMIGCHVDITERKAAEVTLQQTQEELERFFSIALDLLCIADQEGRFRRLNRAWEEILGYPIADLEGRSFLDFVHPDDIEATQSAIATLANQETVQAFVNRYRCQDGSDRYIEWYARPHGALIYAAARDITDRKRTEEHLRKRDAHLRAAQRIARLGSWEFVVASQEILWSEEMYHIFGRDPALGPPTYEQLQWTCHPEDRERHTRAVQTAIATATPYDLECRIYHPDGTLVYIQIQGEPIVDEAGQVVQLVGTVQDITAHKQAQAKLHQTATQLAHTNQELEAFAYSVSHDLRAPLRAIDGFSQALLEDYGEHFEGEALDYCNRIRSNVHRMGLLIDDLLRLSRVSRQDVEMSWVDLSALVHSLAEELSTMEPDRQVEFVIAPEAIAYADVNLIRIALDNLLNNAWKFTAHHATARIEFGVLPVTDTPTYFVRDDGAGFDMAHAQLLFGVFQRLHDTQEFPGTGVGLATVQRIVHRHGGEIWAEGSVEQGATIYFTLPPAPLSCPL